ncbi:MAG: hypothetical protein V1926_01340 [Candidatus Peregrinibacteria bacterium]
MTNIDRPHDSTKKEILKEIDKATGVHIGPAQDNAALQKRRLDTLQQHLAREKMEKEGNPFKELDKELGEEVKIPWQSALNVLVQAERVSQGKEEGPVPGGLALQELQKTYERLKFGPDSTLEQMTMLMIINDRFKKEDIRWDAIDDDGKLSIIQTTERKYALEPAIKTLVQALLVKEGHGEGPVPGGVALKQLQGAFETMDRTEQSNIVTVLNHRFDRENIPYKAERGFFGRLKIVEQNTSKKK